MCLFILIIYYFPTHIPPPIDLGKQVMQAMNETCFSYVGRVNDWVLLSLTTGDSGPVLSQKCYEICCGRSGQIVILPVQESWMKIA